MIPRAEHPQPQKVRENWLNLNGQWEFEIDKSRSGAERDLQAAQKLSGRITVPFCPESELSGVAEKDFLNCVWYRKEILFPQEWIEAVKILGERIVLHFGAVDYRATVYVDSVKVSTHIGGYSPFSIDITDHIDLFTGQTVITVCAEDEVRAQCQPVGKQSQTYHSRGCFYSRTTGIWQTVWLERVPKAHIVDFRIYPDIHNGSVRVSVKVSGRGKLTLNAAYEGEEMATATVDAEGETDVVLKLRQTHLWEPGKGRLYDLELSFECDHISSYFGMREVKMDGMKFILNGKSVFQRLVLDQGFYPEGIYTAPNDEALKKDIEMALTAGFNGARLHEKVFEPRFLYYCDKMGYMVWGEYPNWGLDLSDYRALTVFLPEWISILERDFNHPSIIGWCPFNETWDNDGRRQRDEILQITYDITKKLDSTRLCIDTSGFYHVATDIFDLHDYDQDPKSFRQRYDAVKNGGELDVNYCVRNTAHYQHYQGGPLLMSEYGGIKWDVTQNAESWGYGNIPQTQEEFIDRYRKLTVAILENDQFCGFCYTQLYDVEQETNGLYTYARQPKFDMDIFKQINTTVATIEEQINENSECVI